MPEMNTQKQKEPAGRQAKRAKGGFPDYSLVIPVILLAGIGVAMVYSASCEIAVRQFGNEYYFFEKQLIYAGMGVSAMLILSFVPYRIYRPLAYFFLVSALVLLCLLLFTGAGCTAGGATRWIRIGGLSFQPTEFAKMAFIIFMAYSLAKKQERVEELDIGFLPHVIVLCILSVLILLQPDFGSIALMWLLAWVIMYAGRVRTAHLASAFLAVMPAAVFLVAGSEYRLKRFLAFLDPWSCPMDEGYQIIHSLMAFGSGGVLGKGFGQGYQKLFYLPAPHTDFIFSVIGEEGGCIWIFIVIFLYLIILWRGIEIARERTDFFGSLLALGITVSIALQAAVNMGVSLSLLPTKGLTLPFLSYGGTSLLINMMLVGILINIGKSRQR